MSLALIPLAGAQTLRVTGELPAWIEAGGNGSVMLDIVLDDPEGQFDEGVLFLNVVLDSREQGWPQAAHRVFAAAAEQPTVFRRVISGDELRAGVRTELTFDLKRNAPVGDYVLVIQLYEGRQTNPRWVRTANRVGQVGFPFTILPRGSSAPGR